MRVSKNESLTASASTTLKKFSKRKTPTMDSMEKENLPSNVLSIQNIMKAARGGSPLTDSVRYKGLESPNLYAKSDIKRGSIHQSPPSTSSLEKSAGNIYMSGGAGDRRKRSITPKTLKELLAEKRKKLSFSPSPESQSKNCLPVRVTEILGRTRAEPKGSPKLDHSHHSIKAKELVQPQSPGPNCTAVELIQTRRKSPQLCTRKGLLITLNCINHPLKKSSFYLVQDDRVVEVDQKVDYFRGICSKCAVKVANAGFQVEEIETDEEEAEKRDEFNSFIYRVKMVGELTELALADNQSKQQALFDYYQKQSESISNLEVVAETFVKSIRRSLVDIKNWVQKEGQKEMQKFKNAESVLKVNQRDISLFVQNLGENFEDTLKMMDLENLRTNVKKFEEQLGSLIESDRQSISSRICVVRLEGTQNSFVQDIDLRLKQVFRGKQDYMEYENKSQIIQKVESTLKEIDRDLVMVPNAFRSINPDNMCVSFDAKNASFHRIGQVNDLRQSSTQNFISTLDRIAESQHEKSEFYDYIANQNPEDPLFILSPTEADFSNKQTPELGQKDAMPEFLQNQLTQMHRATTSKPEHWKKSQQEGRDHITLSVKQAMNNSHMDSSMLSQSQSRISDLDELFNFIGKKTTPKNKVTEKIQLSPSVSSKSKCQKILFLEQPQQPRQEDNMQVDDEFDPGLDENLLNNED